MGLPEDNNSFQKGIIKDRKDEDGKIIEKSGFTLEGMGKAVKFFKAANGNIVEPCYGEYFARLDDPDYAIDGARKDPKHDKDLETTPANTEEYGNKSYKTVSGREMWTAHATDGAILSCKFDGEEKPEDSITQGDKLCFSWDFLRFDQLPGNDFAIFLLEDLTGKIIESFLLCDVRTLQRRNLWHRGWRVFEYESKTEEPFLGRLKWVVSNAERLGMDQQAPGPEGYSNPSALLIDCIWIEKA